MSDTTTHPERRAGTRTRRRGAVVEYDFAAPARLSREHTRLLEVAADTFARQWTTQLASRLTCPVAVGLAEVTQSTYDAYVESMPAVPALVVFTLDLGDPATSVLQLTSGTALAHLDHSLGGPGGTQPERTLTEIETTVTLAMVTRALGTLGYAFAALGSPAATVEGLQQDAQLLGAGKATDVVVVATFTVQVGEHTENATLMLPMAPLLQRLGALAPQDVRTPAEIERAAEAARTMRSLLPEVPVEAAVSMSGLRVPPEQVLALAVGDVLRLSHPTDRPLLLSVAGVPVARAVTTSRGPRRAALIVSREEDSR